MAMTEAMMLVLQMFCCGEALYRGNGWKALYWTGAFAVTMAIVRGIKT